MILLSSFLFHNADIEILRELNLNRPVEFDRLFQFISNSVSIVVWGLPLLLLIIAVFRKYPQLKIKSIFILSSVSLSGLLSLSLKHIIDRPRPFETYDFVEKLSYGGSPSFPSGHTSVAFAFALALSLAYPKWYVKIPSFIFAFAIGYTRMSLGVHYPSDIVAGIVLGFVSAIICYMVLKNPKIIKAIF